MRAHWDGLTLRHYHKWTQGCLRAPACLPLTRTPRQSLRRPLVGAQKMPCAPFLSPAPQHVPLQPLCPGARFYCRNPFLEHRFGNSAHGMDDKGCMLTSALRSALFLALVRVTLAQLACESSSRPLDPHVRLTAYHLCLGCHTSKPSSAPFRPCAHP